MSNAAESSLPWHPVTRIAFRFFAVYFALYIHLGQLLGALTPQWLQRWTYPERTINRVVQWTGTHIFHVAAKQVPTGSGDTAFQWVLGFCILVIAVVVAVAWSILDRRRERYDRTYRWFRVMLRFALGGMMLIYGFDKVFPLQMPAPQLARLLEPYGNFSPMGVLWYSIGASFPYERFVGLVEVMGAVLVLMPRTQLAGALVLAGATFEVFMLNMTYDVPVKQFSFHLFVMALLLIAPHAKRISAAVFSVSAKSTWAAIAQTVVALFVIGTTGYGIWQTWKTSGPHASKPPLYGIWTVEKMTIDGVERAPLVTDYDRWRRVIVQRANAMIFWRMDDSNFTLTTALDQAAQSLALKRGEAAAGALAFQQPAPDQLILDGTVDGHALHMETRLFDHTQMLLLTRGFHWVQEFPFNR